MSLAFALMAAINGSAGSSATLSHGLKGTKPHRRQSDGRKDSHSSWATAQAVPDAVGQTNTMLDFLCVATRSRFWGEPLRSRRAPSGRLGRYHEVSRNGCCQIRTRGLVCPTASAVSGSADTAPRHCWSSSRRAARPWHAAAAASTKKQPSGKARGRARPSVCVAPGGSKSLAEIA